MTQRVAARCPICRQARVYVGPDAVELAELWTEDGNHACIDMLPIHDGVEGVLG